MAKTPPDPPILISRKEAARLLGISQQGLINLEHDGVFVPIRLRSSVRYRRVDIEAKIAELAAGLDPRNPRKE